MKNLINQNKAVLIGKLFNLVLAVLGAIFCIYGIYLQTTNNL